MSESISTGYMNTLVFELQKAFWDERGKGARFRMTTIGKELFNEKIFPQLDDSSLEGVLNTVNSILMEEGLIQQGSLAVEDRLVRLKISSCVHCEVAKRFADLGLPPCTCLPANICALAINKKLNRPAEIAEIKFKDGHCEALIVVFEQ